MGARNGSEQSPEQASAVAILGSAFDFDSAGAAGLRFEPQDIATERGVQRVHYVRGLSRPAAVIFRHGQPHTVLPNQINYRALALALRELGCRSLLVSSSVGVMDGKLPLFRPLLLDDILMPDNRLPDGSACTLFDEPTPGQGHLVLEEGLFSRALTEQLAQICAARSLPVTRDVIFAYVGGPRTKTRAENRYWAAAGAQVNSMTLAPEVVLAAELEIPCVGFCVGHKYSAGARPARDDHAPPVDLSESLVLSRGAQERIIFDFLEQATPVAPGNRIYRFADERAASQRA